MDSQESAVATAGLKRFGEKHEDAPDKEPPGCDARTHRNRHKRDLHEADRRDDPARDLMEFHNTVGAGEELARQTRLRKQRDGMKNDNRSEQSLRQTRL